jgi:hypothetical protein
MRIIGMKAVAGLSSAAASVCALTWLAIGPAVAADMPASYPPPPPATGYYAPPAEPAYPPPVVAYPVAPAYPYYAPPVVVVPRPYPYYGWGYGRPFYRPYYGYGPYYRRYGYWR